MMIHAFAASKAGSLLRPITYEAPPLSPFEVLLRVTHCGLCHSDIHLIDNNWNKSIYPLVPGHEVIGTILQKGPEATVQIGQRVGVSWIRSACLQCPCCLQGDTNICPQKKTTCNGHHGGFADHMVADSRFVFSIPDELDSAHAAPLLCAGATLYGALKKTNAEAHQKVAILGIGGLGHLGLQFASAMGCDVTALSHSKSKEQEAKRFGAHHFLNLQDKLSPSQFNILIVTSHEDLDWNQLLALLKPKGTLCFLGRTQKPAAIDTGQLISTQKTITGNSTATRSQMNDMLAFAARHSIKPKVEIMPLSNVNQAIEKLKNGSVRYRIVFTV